MAKSPKGKGLECCTIISLMENDLEGLPIGLVCSNLEILLFGFRSGLASIRTISDQFFCRDESAKRCFFKVLRLLVKSFESSTNIPCHDVAQSWKEEEHR